MERVLVLLAATASLLPANLERDCYKTGNLDVPLKRGNLKTSIMGFTNIKKNVCLLLARGPLSCSCNEVVNCELNMYKHGFRFARL